MKRLSKTHRFPVACLAVLLACVSVCMAPAQIADGAAAARIPEGRITALQEELAEAGEASSSIRKRRAYKNVARDGEDLLKAAPAAPNRWRVLEIVFQGRKRLLSLENNPRNLEDLVETCRKLAEAPDEFAGLRLEADLLLSEKELSLGKASMEQRARALAGLIERYRGTPGEAKSLIIASQIAPKIEAFELEEQIHRAMEERFSDHHGVIEFRRQNAMLSRMDVLFRGTFQRTDGTTLSFPVDRMGHLCIMVFWSKNTQGFEKALKMVNEHEELLPGRFEFYSFNLDELPDGGEETLRALDLDWTVLRLPGGKNSQNFRTYGRRDPVAVFVNAYGHAILKANTDYGRGQTASGNPYKINDARISGARYLAQMQSLFSGDFLVDEPVAGTGNPKPPAAVPAATLGAIQDCFTPAPFRYRLTREKALANYQRAAQLCSTAIAQHANAPDLWRVRNRRIIALMGLWKLTAEPVHLKQAVQEARAALATPPPPEAGVVPRFCLATNDLRGSDADTKAILSALVDATGGSRAHAAAAILALNANSRELHEHHRATLLERHAEDPTIWPVLAFLRDRYHTLHLLTANYVRHEGRVSIRAHIVNHGMEPMTRRLPDIALKTLDGGTLTLPRDNGGKLTLLLFVEPPADPEADFPVMLDRNGRPTRNDPLRNVMAKASELAGRHVNKEVDLVTAFLCDDADRVRSLMQQNEWTGRAAIVPGGRNNPMVRQLGILSADRIPNVFLLRRDGTIAWHTSGFFYKAEFGYPFSVGLAMKVHIEVCDTELAYKALAADDFKEAKRVFSGPFLPEKDERYRWRGPRFHGRALANIGLQDWTAALADIDTAIEAHQNEFDHAPDRPCGSMVEMQRVRATLLEKLGRPGDAEVARKLAATNPTPYQASIYDRFHGKLKELGPE